MSRATPVLRHVRRACALSALAIGSIALSTPASAQASFWGWQLAGGWPLAQMTAGSDWSSDLGADYRYDASSDGTNMTFSGQGRNWSSRAYGPNETNVTVGWEGTARGGLVGQTFAGGEVTVGPAQVLTGNAVARVNIHLWSVLGDNDAGYGISADSRHNGYAGVFLGPAPLNLHWRIDWTSTTSGNAITSASLYFAGVFNQQIGGTSGSASGMWPYAGSSNGINVFPDVQFTSSAGDNAGDPRSGRIDTWVTVSLSTQPIQAVVPEPSSFALLAGGSLLLLGVGRRVRRARG
ncbi:MAG: PEP-CTERM sorting domain-containing protein [Gemmatimonadetes bacterium]|nr:PEP-CTERM sorting domain-containing protein [Gemmatimonadota bacterium]